MANRTRNFRESRASGLPCEQACTIALYLVLRLRGISPMGWFEPHRRIAARPSVTVLQGLAPDVEARTCPLHAGFGLKEIQIVVTEAKARPSRWAKLLRFDYV